MLRIWKENMLSHSINTYTVSLNIKQKDEKINDEFFSNSNNEEEYKTNLENFNDLIIQSLWNHYNKSKKELK